MEERPFSDISYHQYLSEEKLMGSRCKKCERSYTPPRQICIDCFSSDMEWIEMKGTGTLAAFTCITVAPKMMIEEGYGRKNPYCVGVVKLDEGTRVIARIEGVDPKNPETIKVGTPMKASYIHADHRDPKKTILSFQPC